MGTAAANAFDSLEVVQTGVTTASAGTGTTNVATIAHNLNYAPIPFGFLNNVTISSIGTNLNVPLPHSSAFAFDTTNHVVQMQTWIYITTDIANLYIEYYNTTGISKPGLPLKYLLLREKVN